MKAAKRATAKEAFRLFQRLVILKDEVEDFICTADNQLDGEITNIFDDPGEDMRNATHRILLIMGYLSEIEILERKTAEKLSEK